MIARAFALAAAMTLVAGAARADAIGDDLAGYYRGERNSAFVIGGVGVLGIAGGSALATQQTDFARGMGWSLIGLGAVQVIGGTFYVFQVNGQIDKYEAMLARDPAEFKRVEGDHIATTTSRFVAYRLAEASLGLAGAGVAAYGFATNRDAFKGAGIGVAIMAIPISIVDAINMSRAASYRDHLRDFTPGVALSPGGGWQLSMSGRF